MLAVSYFIMAFAGSMIPVPHWQPDPWNGSIRNRTGRYDLYGADGRRVLCRHGNLTGYLCAELWTCVCAYIVNPLTGMFSDGSNVNFVAFILAGVLAAVLTVIMLGWGIKGK